ncbi:threonine--tRNA ligase [Candidatus Roizmanbacteria bacterium CG_4_9_14_0_2_um_filter_39_13]|uniref:Threonine--tRNA ligase n=1 Tax=Candidatus Roizmanbacteria bacterium CG_4_9_14_0_2_um_filter_39_13 TaxID=1974839 RepID=A0A2M8F399_9BACT|nr:MAG: threonine--tRNA ligase [Candidatus Roizmanbacteria bacterium CG_4_10_14_0_2_um_filter_39_12]PJC33759.1 MAG: threonine--tRNA ligase [Candidatus Roizmanbacteria bacterium CG_4_9_14_0_2_um_filter_39_13]
MKNKDYLHNLRHSAEHVLHQAVKELYPQIHLAMGPATEDGFYFDFDSTPEGQEPVIITEKEFPKIEKHMRKIISRNLPIIKDEISIEEAKKLFKDNPYKLEWTEEASSRGEKITIYWTGKPDEPGSMVDLCAGPHVASTGEIKAFKLLSVAGAYWRGDEKNKMLTRIYGTAFESKEELDLFLHQQEEAKKRDHRKLGQELKLFFIDEAVGKGLVMWLPNGTIVRDEIEKLVKEKEKGYGYVRVATPHIAKEDLYLRSGHLPYYKDSMYPGMKMDDAVYFLKAMNCPHHHMIYKHTKHSYRELPLRLAEYGTCYRNELSGTLAGLLRVRGMAMNDAHIYLRKDQIKEEFKAVIRLTQEYFEIFGLKDYWFRLSKWDPKNKEKYIDEPENWDYSQQMIREVLQEMKVEFIEVDDEAAFYGPKVDVQFKSVIGREESMSTIQLDFAAKKRFDLVYTDEKGKENNEVFVIHRAPLSVHERFIAFLIEHYAGAFPLWLTPVQVKIIPIAERHNAYVQELSAKLSKEAIRVEVDERAESMQKKIRNAQQEKVFYMIIVGDQEIENKTINVRTRDGGTSDMKIEEFITSTLHKIHAKDVA